MSTKIESLTLAIGSYGNYFSNLKQSILSSNDTPLVDHIQQLLTIIILTIND
jgi:hypothetical protein